MFSRQKSAGISRTVQTVCVAGERSRDRLAVTSHQSAGRLTEWHLERAKAFAAGGGGARFTAHVRESNSRLRLYTGLIKRGM